MTKPYRGRRPAAGIAAWLVALCATAGAAPPEEPIPPGPRPEYAAATLRRAVEDLIATFGDRYARGREHLAELTALEAAIARGEPAAQARFEDLKRRALLANPLLESGRLLVVKRKSRKMPGAFVLWSQEKATPIPAGNGLNLGLPSNHECNASLDRLGYDNEIAVLSPIAPGGKLTALYRPADSGYVGELDLHWSAERLLFTRSDRTNWKLWEIGADGRGLRQVSRMPDDVDCMDPCYLPDGGIVCGTTAPIQAVPCWHGLKRVTNLYRMNADGSGARQLCFDQDHDLHPSVLQDGQVIYSRWDYTGISHIFLRQLMRMNPDGTGQRAAYGSNSWFPNALYFPREVPERPGRLVCILSGYHGVHRMGQLVLVDTTRGWHEAEGLVLRISGRGDPIRPAIRDNLVDDDWPKFLHPYPLSDKHFLVACLPGPAAQWGIYLADVFDNLVLIREEPGYALLEPVPVRPAPRPALVSERGDASRGDATVYLHDVHAGPGLAGVPRGAVKGLRVVAYEFGYPGMAGPDRVGCAGPWEVMRILGTVPLEDDGSAVFRVPACTPLAFQALDADGHAVQWMRSWFTAQPGESVSCVGCHEPPSGAPPPVLSKAARCVPREIVPWRGPARGFDFAREVQPVLDAYCVSCHDGRQAHPDLRRAEHVPHYRGRRVSDMDVGRMHPTMLAATGGLVRFSPAYESLLDHIRRVGIEDDVSLLAPGEYHVGTSPLVQMLRKGHQGVRLSREAWDRLGTWIDLNGPCHGSWDGAFPVPDGARERRTALRRAFGGPVAGPEEAAAGQSLAMTGVLPPSLPKPGTVGVSGWPFSAEEARRRQAAAGGRPERMLDLGGGVAMRLMRIPAGEFVMGDPHGEPDELPVVRVRIGRPFWLGALEVTNGQYRQYDPGHDSRYYVKRHARGDDQGLTLSAADQPVVRVSWDQAMAFCGWLSRKTGARCSLPTEAQWEWACRAGSAAPWSYGGPEADFSAHGNLADLAFSRGFLKDGTQRTGGLEHLVLEGAALADRRFDDRAIVTAAAGSYRPNVWGLFDMHGNAAEWTRTIYRPDPSADDPRDDPAANGLRAVRGGSFFDPSRRCRSAFRLGYPPWQRLFNVGFRVVCED